MENKDSLRERESEEKNTNILKEGKAEILIEEKNVFYNPVQEFNRDLRYVLIIIKRKSCTQSLQS